jgi:hypothetical protein
VGEDRKQRALEKLARLSAEPQSLVTFWDQASDVLKTAVPHFNFPCWYTVDPASLLITSHYNPYMPTFPAESLALEYYGDDVNKIVDVARSQTGVSTVHDATGGDPSGSPRWQSNIAMGGDQEMVAALRTRPGESWGALGLYREPGQPMFDQTEKRFVQHAAPYLAEGARRSLLFGEANEPETPHAPGLLVTGRSSPRHPAWIDGSRTCPMATRKPASSLGSPECGGQALRSANSTHSGEVAMARVLTRSGTWVVLQGAALRARSELRGCHRGTSSPGTHHRASDVRLRADRPRAGGHPTGPPRWINNTDRRQPSDVPPHRSTTPQERLRQDGRSQSPRSRGQSVLRPLRTETARQRETHEPRPTPPRRPCRHPLAYGRVKVGTRCIKPPRVGATEHSVIGLHRPFPRRTVRRTVVMVIALVRVARVLLILVLACMTISFVMGIGTGSTGVLEKVVLLGLVGGCVYAAAKVTTLSEWAVRRLEHR